MKILILSPHPDDAELCMGGTINKLSKLHTVDIVYFSHCSTEGIEKESVNALNRLELSGQSYSLGNHSRIFDLIRQDILDYLLTLKGYDVVYCPHPDDYHQDHKVIAEEAIRAFSGKAKLIFYLWPKNLANYSPNHYEVLSYDNLTAKVNALKCYESQKDRHYFKHEVIVSIAVFNGIRIGVNYAEAFQIYLTWD